MFWGSKEKEIELEVDDITFNLKQKGGKTELKIIKIERPNETWDLTPYSFDLDIYSLQDDEIKQLLHEATEPIYEIFYEIQNKKKDWMPDDELDELLGFESLLDDIFFLDFSESPDYCDFEQVISGIKKEENGYGYIEEQPYKIEDFFLKFDYEIENLIDQLSSDNNFIKDGFEKYYLIRFKLFMIFWSAFYINEDLLDIVNFWREFSRYRCIINHKGFIVDYVDYPDKYNKYEFDKDYLEKIKIKYQKQKLKFQKYQKSYFYNKHRIKRSAHIFKDFIIGHKQKLNVN